MLRTGVYSENPYSKKPQETWTNSEYKKKELLGNLFIAFLKVYETSHVGSLITP